MSEPYVGEIRMIAGNFAPRGWAYCDGQLLAISQNDALFGLLGTIYGGDGRTTFGLPDLRGRLPVHAGSGPGLSPRRLGSKGGAEDVTLTVNQLPSHTHTFHANTAAANTPESQGKVLAARGATPLFSKNAAGAGMAASMIGNTGGAGSHNNMMPAQCVHFIIALFGVFPSRP